MYAVKDGIVIWYNPKTRKEGAYVPKPKELAYFIDRYGNVLLENPFKGKESELEKELRKDYIRESR